jgi:hypothetical protein
VPTIQVRHTFTALIACITIASIALAIVATSRGAGYESPAAKRAEKLVRQPTAIERIGVLRLVQRHRHDPNYFIERDSRLVGLCVSRNEPRLATVVIWSPHADEFMNAVERKGRLRWSPLPERPPLPRELQNLQTGTLAAPCGRTIARH